MLLTHIATIIVGIICIALGISHTRGNISSLHSYHRNRVAAEDILPFGRAVGLGTIICGIAVLIYSIFSIIAHYTQKDVFVLIGTVILIVGLAVGIVISLYAINKYNHGIF